MARIVEIRTYNLIAGSGPEYERLFNEQAAPILAGFGIDVVAFGASLGNPDCYYLIRAYDNVAQWLRAEEAFYNSAEWRMGPREAVVALIESYTDLVLELDEATIVGLRRERP